MIKGVWANANEDVLASVEPAKTGGMEIKAGQRDRAQMIEVDRGITSRLRGQREY